MTDIAFVLAGCAGEAYVGISERAKGVLALV